MPTFAVTRRGYANLWDRAQVRPEKRAAAAQVVTRMLEAARRAAFESVEAATGVPWWMVACILWRESDLRLDRYLGNGQPLNKRTTVVPIGRGPFPTFLAGAIDAISLQKFAGIARADWTIERVLFWLEAFNGLGYYAHDVNDPYLWSWTTKYGPPEERAGKYVADRQFSATEIDQQGGCAAVLKVMEAQNIVKFSRERFDTAPVINPKEKPVVTTPTVTLPVDQIESLVENVLERFGSFAVSLVPAGPGKDALNQVMARLPDIELELKLESVREHLKGVDPAQLSAALAQVARNWADKVSPQTGAGGATGGAP